MWVGNVGGSLKLSYAQNYCGPHKSHFHWEQTTR